MNRGSPLSVDNILRFLQLRQEGASLSELQGGLKLRKSVQRPLLKILCKLKKRKAIVELTGGRFVLSSRRRENQPSRNQTEESSHPQASSATPHGRNPLSGRLILHQDGYGFVVPDKPMPQLDRDVFIPRDAVGDAMHGDHVLINLGRVSPGPAGQRAEGRIVRVLDRAHPTVVGLFRYGPRGNVVLPYDTRIQHQVEIPPGDELTSAQREKLGVGQAKDAGSARRIDRIAELDGAVVNVELMRFPRGGVAPVGRVVEILGKPGDLGVDTEIIIRKHHLPHEFSAAVLEETARRARPVYETDLESRDDFRNFPIVSIYGRTARGFDDAR